jgi:PAS domain S-box-containing protein
MPYHPLLAHQLNRFSVEPLAVGESVRLLLDQIDATYKRFDEEKVFLQRSIELNSEELLDANRDLRRKQEEFRLFVDSMQDMLFILDSNLTIVAAYGRLLGQIGFSAQDAIGMSLDELVKDPDSRQKRDRALEEALAGRNAVFGWSIEVLGEVRYLETSVGLILADPGVTAGIAGVTRDVTSQAVDRKEREMLEVQLRHAQKLESIGQLAAGISHEINTPTQFVRDNLVFLKGSFGSLEAAVRYITVLSRDPRDDTRDSGIREKCRQMAEREDYDFLIEEIPRSLEQALEGIDRVATIVQSMKEFSSPGPATRVLVDVRRSIQNTVTVARNRWKYISVVDIDVDPDLPLIPGLPGELSQVFLNLIINAADAIAEKNKVTGRTELGNIRIAVRNLGDRVEIRLSDTGTGIPEQIRARVFDPFFTTKGVGQGAGQGLALSHHVIVKKHGGSIRFESRHGEGTTFILQLPVSDCEDLAAA